MHFWKQDLTERKRDGKKPIGGIAREGRATWHLTEMGIAKRDKSISWEWHFFTPGSTGAYVEVEPGGDYDYSFHIGLMHVFSVWLHLSGLLGRLHKRLRPTAEPRKKDCWESRQLGFSIHDGLIMWQIWKDPDSWSSTDGWRNASFNVSNFVFGKPEYSKRVLEQTTATIPMPEGVYPAKIELTEDSWKRARERTKRIRRATVTPETPIPVPGKGENSWDCGDSHISSLTTPAATVHEAVSKYVSSVLRDRERYGGKNWAA